MVTKSKPDAAQSETQVLTRVLKDAVKSGKYTIGTKNVISELKSAKVVIAANSVPKSMEDGSLTKETMKSKVPLVRVDRSSAEIGKLMGRPFRVSAVALRAVSEGDLRILVETTAAGKSE